MLCPWRTYDLGLHLVLTVILVTECVSSQVEGPASQNNSFMQQMSKDKNTLDSSMSCMDGKQMRQNNSLPLPEDNALCMDGKQMKQNKSLPLSEVNSSLSVQMGTKAMLCCPPVPLTRVLIITWEISHRGNPVCKLAYSREANTTREANCTDGRITWASRPDQSPHLQIDAVATTHDGYYKCQVVSLDGNHEHGYHLQVLVPPKVSLFPGKNRTSVCEAAAGKPAAQIVWTPEGDCVTEKEWYSNDTVTVRSTCHFSDSSVSTVTCLVSHPTGNKSLSIDLLPGAPRPEILYIQYVIPPIIIILIIMGSIWLLKISGYRKCKLEKKETTLVVEEDEMQPYASYTEKSNPLYDTINKVKTSQVTPGQADSLGLQTL